MSATITREEAAVIAANYRKTGRPVPAGLEAPPADPPAVTPPPPAPVKAPVLVKTPAAVDATAAAGTPRKTPAPARAASPAAPRSAPAARARPTTARRSGGKPARKFRDGAPTRGLFSGSSMKRRATSFVNHPAGLGGDGGGLLIAVWLYPLVLSIIKYGPTGPGLWMRAKFLNKGTSVMKGGKIVPGPAPAAPGTPADIAPGGTFSGGIVPLPFRQAMNPQGPPPPPHPGGSTVSRAN